MKINIVLVNMVSFMRLIVICAFGLMGLVYCFASDCRAEFEGDPWSRPGNTDEEISKLAPERLKAISEEMENGICHCAPRVEVKWDNFTIPRFRYLSFKVLDRIKQAMESFCGLNESKYQLCTNLAVIEIDFGEDSSVAFQSNDTLYVRVARHFIPGIKELASTLQAGLHLKQIPEKKD